MALVKEYPLQNVFRIVCYSLQYIPVRPFPYFFCRQERSKVFFLIWQFLELHLSLTVPPLMIAGRFPFCDPFRSVFFFLSCKTPSALLVLVNTEDPPRLSLLFLICSFVVRVQISCGLQKVLLSYAVARFQVNYSHDPLYFSHHINGACIPRFHIIDHCFNVCPGIYDLHLVFSLPLTECNKGWLNQRRCLSLFFLKYAGNVRMDERTPIGRPLIGE